MCTWGMPAAFRGGLRSYRHWTEKDIDNHLQYLSGIVKKIIRKVGDFDWDQSFITEQIEEFKNMAFLQNVEYDRPSLEDIRKKWKQNQVQFPTCATDEGNMKYQQILLHSGLTSEMRT